MRRIAARRRLDQSRYLTATRSGLELFDDLVTIPAHPQEVARTDAGCVGYTRGKEVPAIKIVLDITRLVEEGKLSAHEAERLQTLAKRDTGSLAINVLMSFGAVAVTAGIIALEPTFTTGAALGVTLVAIGLAISFFATEQWGLSVPPLPSSARCCWRAGSSGLSRPISPGSPSRRSYSWRLQSRSIVVS